MRCVIDASTIGSFVLPDEAHRAQGTLESLMSDAEFVQPAHWPIEVAGLVVKGARRNRLGINERSRARELVGLLIAAAEIEPRSAALAALDLAVAYHISVYDAAYLELAQRQRLPLMTGDGALAQALPKAGVRRLTVQ